LAVLEQVFAVWGIEPPVTVLVFAVGHDGFARLFGRLLRAKTLGRDRARVHGAGTGFARGVGVVEAGNHAAAHTPTRFEARGCIVPIAFALVVVRTGQNDFFAEFRAVFRHAIAQMIRVLLVHQAVAVVVFAIAQLGCPRVRVRIAVIAIRIGVVAVFVCVV